MRRAKRIENMTKYFCDCIEESIIYKSGESEPGFANMVKCFNVMQFPSSEARKAVQVELLRFGGYSIAFCHSYEAMQVAKRIKEMLRDYHMWMPY